MKAFRRFSGTFSAVAVPSDTGSERGGSRSIASSPEPSSAPSASSTSIATATAAAAAAVAASATCDSVNINIGGENVKEDVVVTHQPQQVGGVATAEAAGSGAGSGAGAGLGPGTTATGVLVGGKGGGGGGDAVRGSLESLFDQESLDSDLDEAEFGRVLATEPFDLCRMVALDASAFQVTNRTPLEDVHVLFEMLRVRVVFVVRYGVLQGIISRRVLIQAGMRDQQQQYTGDRRGSGAGMSNIDV